MERKVPKNNVSAMKQKLAEMENKLTWVSWEMFIFYAWHCEPEGDVPHHKRSRKYTESQHMIHGSSNPGQQFSLSLV